MCLYSQNMSSCDHYPCVIIADVKSLNPHIFQGPMKDYHKKMPKLNIQMPSFKKDTKKAEYNPKSYCQQKEAKELTRLPPNSDMFNNVFYQNPNILHWMVPLMNSQNHQNAQVQRQQYQLNDFANQNNEEKSAKAFPATKKIYKKHNKQRRINNSPKQSEESRKNRDVSGFQKFNQMSQQKFINEGNINSRNYQFDLNQTNFQMIKSLNIDMKQLGAQHNQSNSDAYLRQTNVGLSMRKENEPLVRQLLEKLQIISKQNQDQNHLINNQRDQLLYQKNEIKSLHLKLFNLQGMLACHTNMINQLFQHLNNQKSEEKKMQRQQEY